ARPRHQPPAARRIGDAHPAVDLAQGLARVRLYQRSTTGRIPLTAKGEWFEEKSNHEKHEITRKRWQKGRRGVPVACRSSPPRDGADGRSGDSTIIHGFFV